MPCPTKLLFVGHGLYLMVTKRLSPLAHTAYQDLLRNLKEQEVSDFKGTPVKKTRGKLSFWYDTYRVGHAVKTKYIGPDTEELRERIQRFTNIKLDQEARQRERRRLIRILRVENFLGVDSGTGSLLSALAASGTFRLGGTIIGTHAFRLYEGELGIQMSFDQLAITNDIAIAVFERHSLALEDTASPLLNDVLSHMNFKAIPSLKQDHNWRWQQHGEETLVEFLTPSFSEAEDIRILPSLGVYAQSLHHLKYLIEDPIAAALTYRSGILVHIPRPERFAIHKLMITDRRLNGPSTGKSQKDLMQAHLLIKILAEDRPDELLDAYKTALNSGPQWKARIEANLKKNTDIAAILNSL